MKKIISIMLLLLFPIMMLSACGKPNDWKLALDTPAGIELQVDDNVLQNNQKINDWKNGKEIKIYVYGNVNLLNFKLFANKTELQITKSADFQNGLVSEMEKQLYGTVELEAVNGNVSLVAVSNFKTLVLSDGNISSMVATEDYKCFSNVFYFDIETTSLNLKVQFKNLQDNKNLHINIAGGNITLYDAIAGALAGAPTPTYQNGERYHEISSANENVNLKVIYTNKGENNLAVESVLEIVSVEIQMPLAGDTNIEIYQN